MKRILKGLMVSLTAAVLASALAIASDETVTVTAGVTQNGTNIENSMIANWSQGGDYTCQLQNNRLVVVDTSGDCDQQVSRYNFRVQGGSLNNSHSLSLRIRCSSPLVASVNYDGAGFVTLTANSTTSFTGGGDTIHVDFSFPPLTSSCVGVPSMPEWGLIVFAVSVVLAGMFLLRHRPAPVG